MHGLIPPALHRFDLVETTIRFGNYVMEAFRQAFNESGIRLKDKEIKAIRGRSKRDAIAGILQVHSGSKALSMIETVYGTFSEQGVEPVPGTDDVFGWLRDRKVKIALNTGFDRHIVSMLLDRMDWSGIVDAVVCGNDVERGRPAPDLILKAMEQTGCTNPSRVLAVGDTRFDLLAAKNAGVPAVGVLSGAGNEEKLKACPHYAIIPSVADLHKVLS